MPRVRQINLQTPIFNPVGFTPAVFQPQQEEINLLANSLNVLEQRRVAAEDQMAAMDTAFAGVREKLHNDPETMKWFQDYTNQYKQKVDELAQAGDYANALTAARRSAAEAINNPELQARLSTNEEYEKQKAMVMSMDISDIRKQRWLEQNPYDFNKYITSRDANNNPLSAQWTVGNEGWMPVKNVDISGLAKVAENLYAERSSKGNDIDMQTGVVTDSGYAAKYESGIRENFIELLYNTPGAYASVKQDMNDDLWQISKLEERLERLPADSSERSVINKDIENLRSKVLGNNGAPISIEEYAIKNTNNIIKNEAYYRSAETSKYGRGFQGTIGDGEENSYNSGDLPAPVGTSGNIAHDNVKTYAEWQKNNSNKAEEGAAFLEQNTPK